MSKARRRRRYAVDAGDGVSVHVTHRGPIDVRTVEAYRALARAVASRDAEIERKTGANTSVE